MATLATGRTDLQGRCQKVLQRAGKYPAQYPEPSLTRKGRVILEPNMEEQRDP